MWRLEYPWLLLAWPLAWAAYRWLPPYVEARQALRVPFFEDIAQAAGVRPGRPGVKRSRWAVAASVLVWTLMLIAVARPLKLEPPLHRSLPLRDILLAVDISQSMETTDMTDAAGHREARLDAVKAVIQDFIRRREQDRLGLIVFGSAAYPQAPLTLDHAGVSALLDQLGAGMAGPDTAIGDAIGLAIKQFDQSHLPNKVLILLSDGKDTGSAILPVQAAAMAASRGIVIHTIGIGAPDAQGEAQVDFGALQAIARATGGRYFHAGSGQALEEVYRTLDQITPHQAQRLTHQPSREFFWLPLVAAMALAGLAGMPALWRGRGRSRAGNAAADGGEAGWTST